jgi:hypothetical protein
MRSPRHGDRERHKEADVPQRIEQRASALYAEGVGDAHEPKFPEGSRLEGPGKEACDG